ncbi:hypothetical protein [Desulfobacter curvatus]|uniref:hypothetical protein n=1 Tax=Desulfobacter curvatus TaxID=2290 RepID=UPI0003A4DCEF|nr:hypothetical protein [Desulfobacter curvatus]
MGSSLFVVSETDLEAILAMAEKDQYDAMVVDSIQTVFHPRVTSTPGNITQIREASMLFMRLSKTVGLPIFLVEHVTKGGPLQVPESWSIWWTRCSILKGIEVKKLYKQVAAKLCFIDMPDDFLKDSLFS